MSDLVKRLREGTNGTDVTKTDAVLTAYMHEAADRIEALEVKLREVALSELSALGQASEAYTAQLDAEAKLAQAVEALEASAKEHRAIAGMDLLSASSIAWNAARQAEHAIAAIKGEAE